MKISSKDSGLNDYLASIESNETYSRFIVPTFDHHNLPVQDFPKFEVNDKEKTGMDIQSISQALSEWPSGARFVIPGSNYSKDALPAQAPPHQAIVLYDESFSTSNLSIEWNSDRSGCKLLVSTKHPIQHSFRVTDKENLVLRSINASYGNESRTLIVVCPNRDKHGDDSLINIFSNLSELVQSLEYLSDQNVQIFWRGESQFLEDSTNRLACSTLPTDEMIQEYFSIFSDVERLIGKPNRNGWLKGLWGILLSRIVESKGIGTKQIEQLIQTLSTHGPFPGSMISELLATITGNVKNPKSTDELLSLISTLRLLDKDYSPEYPSNLISGELIKSIIEEFPNLDTKLLQIKNALFDRLKALLQINHNLIKMINRNDLERLKNDDDYLLLIKANNASTLSEIANAWSIEMDSLISVLDDESVLEGTQLVRITSKITEITQWTSKLIGAVDPRLRSIYVFDTSALIEHPQIVSEANQDELFVVTKRVIEELDDKKLDEALRPNVTVAVRNLRNLNKEHIQFCDGDMSLLPYDYRMKGDNLILSVAVRYRKYNPVLVTNDNNLALKARAEGLDAINAEVFLKRPKSKSKNVIGKNRDYPQSKKGNQGKKRKKR